MISSETFLTTTTYQLYAFQGHYCDFFPYYRWYLGSHVWWSEWGHFRCHRKSKLCDHVQVRRIPMVMVNVPFVSIHQWWCIGEKKNWSGTYIVLVLVMESVKNINHFINRLYVYGGLMILEKKPFSEIHWTENAFFDSITSATHYVGLSS